MDSDKLIFALIGGFTILIVVFIFFTSMKGGENPGATGGYDKNQIIGPAPIYKGVSPDQAKVVLVEFSDYECPFCAQYPPILNGLSEKYPEQLSIVFRHFPLPGHTGSIPAARASEAANMQGKFWEYNEEAYLNQPNYSEDELMGYAENLGLDLEKFKSDFESSEVAQNVSEDYKTAMELNLNGTPTFFVIYDGKVEKINLTSLGDVENKVDEILGVK